VAGVTLGPLTPGLQDDVEAVRELAELGAILLMFGVGLPFRMHTPGNVCSSDDVLTNITVDLIDPSRPCIREPV
jgi:hypothetical protein